MPRATSSNVFVSSRQTATAALRHRGRKRAQRPRQPLRRLERDDGPRPARELLPERRERLLSARQVADELVPLPEEAARDERRLDGRRAGQHRHRHARLERRADQTRPGIRDAGHPRIRDERHALAGDEPRQKLGRPLRLVVLVIADERAADAVPLEQHARAARVLAEDRRRPRAARAARAASRPRGFRSASRRR